MAESNTLEEKEGAARQRIRLSVAQLRLTHFRNYDALTLQTGGEPVVLTGRNGSGKTNLLEAVSLLVPGRGLRGAALTEMDRQGTAGPWALAAKVQSPYGEVELGTGRVPEPGVSRRRVLINGGAARSQAELADYISVIWLTPAMDRLFNEGASGRRKFFDRLVYSFEPQHARRVNAYEQAMRERNRLLQDRYADPEWLTACECKMVEEGIAIAASRREMAERLTQSLEQAAGAFPRPLVGIEGEIEAMLGETRAVEAEEQFLKMLQDSRQQDARQGGRTSVGVHKSDLTVWHREKNMPAPLCSTGEQKALLLSIIMAHARAKTAWHGSAPVLLLDEVVAHLDEGRRAHLFEELLALGVQAWMTGTDEVLFAALQGKANFMAVDAGEVSSVLPA